MTSGSFFDPITISTMLDCIVNEVRIEECLDLLYSDVFVPFCVHSRGYEYFIIFTNNYSKYGYVPNEEEILNLG